jgi:hypothetical protein
VSIPYLNLLMPTALLYISLRGAKLQRMQGLRTSFFGSGPTNDGLVITGRILVRKTKVLCTSLLPSLSQEEKIPKRRKLPFFIFLPTGREDGGTNKRGLIDGPMCWPGLAGRVDTKWLGDVHPTAVLTTEGAFADLHVYLVGRIMGPRGFLL